MALLGGKKIKTDEGILLTEVIDNMEASEMKDNGARKKKAGREKTFRHANPVYAGIVTVFAFGANVGMTIAGYDAVWGCIVSMIAFTGSMLSKGDDENTFCTVMAVVNAVSATVFLASKLVSIGVFDWLAFTI